MPESGSHRRVKNRAAGREGETEVPVRRGRLDAVTPTQAIEVERSGRMDRLEHAAAKLKASGKPEKILQVPQKDMQKAIEAMKNQRVEGTVKNLSGTKSKHVSKGV